MLGPTADTLGTIALDFFQHGSVAYGGLLNFFAQHEICLNGGFGLNHSPLSNWDLEAVLSAGMAVNSSVSAGFDIEIDISGSVPECS